MKTVRFALLLAGIAPLAASAQDVLVPFNQKWSYLSPVDGVDPATVDPGGDFSNTWFSFTGYDGPAFTNNAQAPIQYGGINYFTANAIVPTTLTVPPSGSRWTAYFKTQFTAAQEYAETSTEILADDGAVIYLDGVEIKRLNMTGTGVEANGFGDDYMMLADDSVRTEDGGDTELSTITIALGPISAGPHTLAVSVHNTLSTSSDIGLHMRVVGAAPPPPRMLTREIGGNTTDITVDGVADGWDVNPVHPGTFTMTGAAAEATLTSMPVDLSTVGSAFAVVTLYAGDLSTGSNFEATDFFRARLELILDDDSTTEINLIPSENDLNADGTLSGDEMNPPAGANTDQVYFSRNLVAAIPANAKSVRLIIAGLADSTSESLLWGSARITDLDPLSDADGDGIGRQDELVAGTNPADRQSYFKLESGSLDKDGVAPTDGFTYRGNTVATHSYAVETSDDGIVWNYLGDITPTVAGNGVIITFGAPPVYPEVFFGRLRPIP